MLKSFASVYGINFDVPIFFSVYLYNNLLKNGEKYDIIISKVTGAACFAYSRAVVL